MMKKLSLRMRLTLLSALVMASVAVILTSMFLFGADRIFVRDLEQKMKAIMGTQVVIKNKNNNKGKIEIEYYSQAELERIYELLQKIN